MRKVARFGLYAGGGLIALMVFGMIISVVFDLNPDEVRSLNSVEDWMFFRLAMYTSVIILWVPICKWLTYSKVRNQQLSNEEYSILLDKREEDLAFLKTYWWKVAIAFAFVEFVFIQQMGL